MRAVLLAAGQATRLRPLTDHCPKCLLQVGDESILARAVRILGACGLRQFTVVDGFCGDLIRTALDTSFPDFKFQYVRNEDFRTTNNAWSLMLADCPADEPIFLLDSDILFEPAVIQTLLDHPAPNRLGLRTTGDVGDEEMKVALGPDGRVSNLTKDMPPPKAAGESVGLEIFSGAFVTDLKTVLARRMHVDGFINEYYEASFVELIQAGHAVQPVDLGPLVCMEIDTPGDLDHARRVFGAT